MSSLIISNTPRPLGNSGIMASPLAWGMWRFTGEDVAAARHKIDTAFGIGITLFDTADIYGFDGSQGFGDAEALLGKVFASDPGLRHKMVLASKGGIWPGVPYDSSEAYLVAACESSLRRLNTDYLDLYQIHRPDILAHPAEVAATLDRLHQAGKIRAVGVSNYTRDQTLALNSFLQAPLVSTQPEFSPLHLDPLTDGVIDLAMQYGVAVMAWSPLGGGRIGNPGQDMRAQAVCSALDAMAARFNVSRAAATYSWIMAHPAAIIPIIGSQTPARISEAADAFKIVWTRADWYNILVAARGEKLP